MKYKCNNSSCSRISEYGGIEFSDMLCPYCGSGILEVQVAPVANIEDYEPRRKEIEVEREGETEGVRQIRKNMKAHDARKKRLNSDRQNDNNRNKPR